MVKNLPGTLEIKGAISSEGLEVRVNEELFSIRYPKEVWGTFSKAAREVLMDNVVYSSTIFLPQMLKLSSILYHTARPASESFLFKNGIYDMPCCALADEASSVEYITRFFNTRYLFAENAIKVPPVVRFDSKLSKQKTAIIPFSFGKESMLSFALCTELGIKPILVNFIESVNAYEYEHKKELIKGFEKETGVKVYTVQYEPSMLRYGQHWDLKTELGWGLQTTEYSLLCLPFAHHFKADYIILGNEQSCNDTFINKEGILTYKAGYDQHGEWATQQGLLSSLLLGRRIKVISFMEPLYELGITRILHHRYPEYGKYQMSCMADTEKAASHRWCQSCVKCGYMYALCCASGLDLKKVGFTKNLFDEDHKDIFDHFFEYDPQDPAYGSQEELGLAFYVAAKKGHKGKSIDRFGKELANRFDEAREKLIAQYLGINSSGNIPDELRPAVLKIYHEELDRFIASL